jgi:hypothetical protein
VDSYITGMPYDTDDAVAWWQGQAAKFQHLCPLALDILAVQIQSTRYPLGIQWGSESYVERMFSVSGELSSGIHNLKLRR